MTHSMNRWEVESTSAFSATAGRALALCRAMGVVSGRMEDMCGGFGERGKISASGEPELYLPALDSGIMDPTDQTFLCIEEEVSEDAANLIYFLKSRPLGFPAMGGGIDINSPPSTLHPQECATSAFRPSVRGKIPSIPKPNGPSQA